MPLYSPVSAAEDFGNAVSLLGGVQNTSRYSLTEFDGASGRLWIAYFRPPLTTTLSQLMIASASSATVSATLARMALFEVASDDSLTLAARTASDTAIGGSTYTPYEKSFATTGGYPATYTVAAGQRYAFGFLQLAATAMKIQGVFVLDSATAPISVRIIEGQTDISASYAVGSLTTYFSAPAMRGRP